MKMNCAYHHDREVHGICNTCGRPICDTCLIELNGQVFCKPCLEVKVHKPAREIHGTVRFVLSIVPGLGHLYMGMFNRGLQFLGVAILGTAFLDMLNIELAPFVWMAMMFWSVFDTREAHLRMQQGLEVEDKGFVDLKTWRLTWNPKYIGYGLVGLGVLAMYNTVVNDLLRIFFRNNALYYEVARSVNGVVLGALAVGAGIWLLRKDSRPQ